MADEDILVQYVIVRKDLTKKPFSWATGSLISNACHASTAVLTENWDDLEVQTYLKNHRNKKEGVSSDIRSQMHTVVLAAQTEEELLSTKKILEDKEIKHHLWVEQPEGIPTALATRPYQRNIIKPLLQSLRLFR